MEKNKKIKLLVLSSMLLVLLAVSGVYAWLTFTTGNVLVAGNTYCFNINYTKGADITGNIGVIEEDDYLTSGTIKLSTAMGFTPISMELDKKCKKLSGTGVLELNVQSLSTAFTSAGNSYGSLKYVVAEYDPSSFKESTAKYLKNHTFNYIRRGIVSSTGTMDIHTEYLNPGEKHNYLVILYIDKNLVGNDAIGASITATGTARAEQFVATPISDFTYSTTTHNGIAVPSNTVLLTSYTGTNTVVNVPSTYTINGTTYDVMVYGDGPNDESTFRGNTTITEVNFANGVKFADLNNEESFTLNSAERLFKGCTSLVNAPKLPDTITSMNNTYEGCTALTNIEYVPSATTSMLGTFKNCTNLEGYVRIPNETVTPDSNTFSGTTKSIIVETHSESISNYNFTQIAPANVTVVDIGPVYHWDYTPTPLSDFTYILGSNQTEITQLTTDYFYENWDSSSGTYVLVPADDSTFDPQTTVYIESNDVLLVRYIGSDTIVNVPDYYVINGVKYYSKVISAFQWNGISGTFIGNDSIEEVNFDKNVSIVGWGFNEYCDCNDYFEGWMLKTFKGCSNLTTVSSIPSNVTSMYNTFEGCESLVSVPNIPDSVTVMHETFLNCTSLVDAPAIGNSVTTMYSAFKGCTSLADAPEIPDLVTNMEAAFANCTSLVNAPTIPDSVTSMRYTFYNCTSLVNGPTIPFNVYNIGGVFDGCTNLTGTIRIEASSADTDSYYYSGTYPFNNTTKPITVEVPAGSTTYYTINNNKPSNITIVQY